jgi:hypothetical protein
MAGAPRELTPQQRAVFATVHHYHEAVGEPAPASYVARKLAITRQRVQEYFRVLSELGWLRSAGTPAVPARPLPAHGGLPKTQLPSAEAGGHASNVASRNPTVQTVDMPALTFRAEIRADSVNVDARTVEVVFSTGAPVLRYDWLRDTEYLESLSLEPKAVRLKRLNNSAPLLNAHGSYEVRDVLGVVVPRTAEIKDGKGTAQVRFSKRTDMEGIWQDVKDGILRNVSVGYKVHEYKRTVVEGKPEIRHAVDWEPYEISVVPMGADDGAKFRGAKAVETNPCRIVTGGEEERVMEDDARSETIAEDPIAPPPARPAAPAEPDETAAAIARERKRNQGILTGCRAARLGQAYADKLIAEGVTLEEAQTRILAELAIRGGDDRGPKVGPQDPQDPIVGTDPLIHVRAGIEGALLHRIAPDRFPLDDKSRPYRGMSMLDVGRAFLNARGVRTTSLDRSRLVDVLLTRTGLHTTTDFPGLFEDAANKNLRAAYEAAPQTWLPISKLVTLSDFKPSRQLQVGDAPALLEILEHGEYTFGTIGEAKEVIQLKTYGRMFGITRQALINDDLNAFGEVPAAFGRKARDIESDLAWAQITTNPNMGDGIALFQAASHFNLTSSGTVISVASLGIGRAALRNQKGIDAATLLNLSAKYLIVPAALETIADQFVTQITPALPTSVNPFGVGGRTPLTTIVEPRLDVASATAWYLATDVASAPLLYHGVLAGAGTGPLVTQQEGFDVDGMKFRCRIDVAFKAADWRAAYKNVGA